MPTNTVNERTYQLIMHKHNKMVTIVYTTYTSDTNRNQSNHYHYHTPPLPILAANGNNNGEPVVDVQTMPLHQLASFLDDVKKFRKDKLKSASDTVANDNDDTSANATSTPRRGSTTSDDLKAQPGSLLDAIRKRAMTVDETNRSRTVSIDDIIASKKKKRAQSYKETGVAAILAHRIAMMGGDLSDNDEEDGSSDDDWE